MSVTEFTVNLQFDQYKLTDEEQVYSKLFTEIQLSGLKNLLIQVVNEKVNMGVPVSGDEIHAYVRRQEYLRGQIDIINYIIATAMTAIETAQQQ